MSANKKEAFYIMIRAKNGAHYAGIFGTCIRKKLKCLTKGVKMFEDKTVIILLPYSPLENTDIDSKCNEKCVAMQSIILV